MRRAAGEDGTVLLLSLGFAALTLGLAAVVADVTAVFLARRSLAAAVDGAALYAAQAIDEEAVYTQGLVTDRLPLADVDRRVRTYRERNYGDVPGLTMSAALDGPTAVRVTGRRVVTLPVRVPGLPSAGRVTVTAEATAESPLLSPG